MTLRNNWFALAAIAVLGVAASAVQAGEITSATGQISVNGQSRTVDKPFVLEPGAVVDTLGSTVKFTSAGGDVVTLLPGTSARSEGSNGMDYLFVRFGTAVAELSNKTAVGVNAGWITVPEGSTTKSEVFVEAPEDRKTSESQFRTNKGSAWITYGAGHGSFRVWLPERHSVTLRIDASQPEFLEFSTDQQNRQDIEIHKTLSGGSIVCFVPRATSGRIEPVTSTQTKISNDLTSFKDGKVRIETRFRDNNQADLGPGTHAIIDNATGAITVVFSAVEFDILERAISLTSEFATLAQSNFSDVQ